MKSILKALVVATKPLIWRLAEAYDLRINRHATPQGQHPLFLKGGLAEARRNIPKSAYFNTRSGSIMIGKNTVFGEDVMVLTGKHFSVSEAEAEKVDLHFVPAGGRDICIGDGCYVGSGAIIIGPVKIGDFCVVGAGAVVTKDVPSRTFVAGVPAKVIRAL